MIAIYTRVMITSDVVGRAVPYENTVGKYGVGNLVGHKNAAPSKLEVWPFDSPPPRDCCAAYAHAIIK
jgi:hypothetical protein